MFRLALIIFVSLPLLSLLVKFFNTRMRKAFKEQRNQLGEINSQVEDSLLGIRVVKSFANEDIESEKFEDGNGKFLDTKKMSYFYMAGFQTANRAFEGIMYLIVVVAGSIFMINGQISRLPLALPHIFYLSALFLLRSVLLYSSRNSFREV